MKELSNLKRFHIGKYERYLLGVIIFATLLRFILLYFNWPPTNSDEGNMGLVARHIAFNGEWPIFFYGAPYMGPIEAYLAAPLFHLLGPTLFALRLQFLLFFVLYLSGMYALTALLHTQRFGLFICLLFSFGSAGVIGLQLKAVGEYPETEFFAVAICVITIWLALYAHKVGRNRRTTGTRILLYAVLGLIIGIAIWVDMLILPFACLGILFLLLFCRRESFSWAGIALILGIIVGLMPLIIYNVGAPPDQNSIAVLLRLHNAGASASTGLWQQIVGTFTISMPGILGLAFSCTPDQAPAYAACVATHVGWSVGYLILWGVAAVMSLVTIWRLWRARQGMSLWHPEWTFEQRRQLVIECGRLMVLICALGTLFLFITSPAASSAPGPTARYLICMLISMPVILWPLWNRLGSLLPKVKIRHLPVLAVGFLIFGLLVFECVAGSVDVFVNGIPAAQSDYQHLQQTVQYLERAHIKYVYSSYWTCNNLTFASEENVICATVNDRLGNGYNRYPAYLAAVKQAPRTAYIFPLGSDEDNYLINQVSLKQLPAEYQIKRIPGYHIFIPE